MRNVLLSIAAAASLITGSALALDNVKPNESKITKGFKTYDSMGCMLLRECTEDVDEVFSLLDISSEYANTEEFTPHAPEFNYMLSVLHQIGVKVYLADSKYFPVNHRGIYHTVGNNFFLNREYMGKPNVLMMLMRHEGWHAAQDCMAGTIENSMLAIILPEESVPMLWRTLAERTYPKESVPWEAEAQWAGRAEGMTIQALEACSRGSMWTEYEPTPLTRLWLEENNYIHD